MKKNWKYYVLATSCIIGIALMSCGSLLDKVTPSEIDERSASYIDKEPNDFGWFHSLYEAEELMKDVLIIRRDKLIDYEYVLQKDEVAYEDAKGYLEPAIARSREAQALFVGSEDQPISIVGLITYLGFGGLGTMVGKNLLKRKGDYSATEYNGAILQAYENGKANKGE